MKIIGFNGPPHSGKDTLADGLAEKIQSENGLLVKRDALAYPMRLAVYALLNKDYSQLHYDNHKDDPQPLLNGESIRQAMIRLSEEHVKPVYGQGFWARHLLQKDSPENPVILIISDIGFQVESYVLQDFVGPENFALIKLSRNGTDWSKDSRGYVEADQTLFMQNNATVSEAVDFIIQHLRGSYNWQSI